MATGESRISQEKQMEKDIEESLERGGGRLLQPTHPSGRPMRTVTSERLIALTDLEDPEDEADDDDDDNLRMPPPKGKTAAAKRKQSKKTVEKNVDVDIERERMAMELEKEKMRLEYDLKCKELELEIEKVKSQKHVEKSNNFEGSLPFKLKLQTYDHKGKEDILTYLCEFEAIAQQAKWTEEVKILQLRTLLTCEAREVAQQANKTYLELKKALIDRFGKKPHEYFSQLMNVRKGSDETYRGLKSRIDRCMERFIDDRDPVECFSEEIFLRALPQNQVQWIRRNKGSGTCVDAAEDYIVPTNEGRQNFNRNFPRSNQQTRLPVVQQSDQKTTTTVNPHQSSRATSNVECFKCRKRGHIARDCQNKKQNPATYLVKPAIGERLISVPGSVNGCDLMFVKDTGSDMTLIKEDLVDQKCKLEGQKITLLTAIGQPFVADLAVVNVDTPYYRGNATVGLVPDLAADALLGMDILQRKNAFAVTRAQARVEKETEQAQEKSMELCGVRPHALGGNDTGNSESDIKLSDISTINAEKLSDMQKADPTLDNVRSKAFGSKEEIEGDIAFFWENGILRRKWTSRNGNSGVQVVLPKALRKSVVKLAHDRPLAGHLGLEKTKERVLSAFYWPGLFTDCKEHCSTCDVCQKTAKKGQKKAPMVVTPIVEEPFTRIVMDIVGPLSRTKKGNKYILTIIDIATRYPEAYPLSSVESEKIANALIDLFSRVAIPAEILTDQGSNFTSTLMKQLYDLLGIQGITSTPYHPETQGCIERFNGTLKSMLKKLCETNEQEWDELVPYALFAYREVPHEQTGFSPFELLYGWPVRGPMQLLKSLMTGEEDAKKSVVDHVINVRDRLSYVTDVVQDNLALRKKKTKQWYDKNTSMRTFKPGEEVLLLLPSDSSKMKAQWRGPFRVIRKVNDVNYQIHTGGRKGIVTYHINMLRKYHRSVLFSAVETEDEGCGMINYPCELDGSIKDVKISPDLTPEQRRQLRDLCEKYCDVITNKPGRTDKVEHSIRTTSEEPIRQKPYRIPHAKRAEVKKSITEMLDQGLIKESTSPYSSPIVPVLKPDKTLRICTDYRKLNEITVFDSYPIPRIDEVFEKLGDAKYISRLDMTKGYFQIPLAEDSREKSSFVTPFGQFEWIVMPFGMKTSPATFARLVDKVLKGLKNVEAYFDDLIVHSRSWEEHLECLTALLQRLREEHLTVKPSKCELGATELVCLGHVAGGGVVKPDKSKVKAVTEYPLPMTKRGVRSFLGMVGYYRRFLKNFSEMAAPLTDMTKKGQPNKVVWTNEAVDAFNQLKEAITRDPVLIAPDFQSQFQVQTDASDVSIGAVLSQTTADGEEHPVAFLSRKLLPREQRYATVEKECLAIVWAVESFAYYLKGVEFVIETDHNPLTWLNQVKDKNQRLLRWSLALQPYSFKIRFRKGKDNANADGLTRIETA